MTRILVDADACPVKDEIYRVAWRYGASVTVVSNSPIRVPDHPLIVRVVVDDRFDAADDWIVAALESKTGAGQPGEAQAGATVIVTGDILLADRCLKLGSTVLSPTGKPFTPASIGSAIATRAIMADLRAGAGGSGPAVGGPPPFTATDRSRFLQELDRLMVKLRRA